MCKAMERIEARGEARGEIFLPWSVCGRALLPMSLKYFHSVVVAALLVGCHALITTAPIVEHCDKCMPDGVYEVKLKGLENVPIRLSVAHDMTNSIYKVDAGEHGCFQAYEGA